MGGGMSKYINVIIIDTGMGAKIHADQFSDIFKAKIRYEQLQQAFMQDWLTLPDLPGYSIKATYQGSILLFTVAVDGVPVITYTVCKKSQDRWAAWRIATTNQNINLVPANEKSPEAPSCPYLAVKTELGFAQAGKPMSHWLEMGLQFAWGWIQ